LYEDKLTELFNQCHTEENCDASIQEVEVFVVGEGAHDRVDQSYSEEGKSKNDSQEESPFSVFCVGYREGSNCSCYAKENEGNLDHVRTYDFSGEIPEPTIIKAVPALFSEPGVYFPVFTYASAAFTPPTIPRIRPTTTMTSMIRNMVGLMTVLWLLLMESRSRERSPRAARVSGEKPMLFKIAEPS
jgi:hypothetical protein